MSLKCGFCAYKNLLKINESYLIDITKCLNKSVLISYKNLLKETQSTDSNIDLHLDRLLSVKLNEEKIKKYIAGDYDFELYKNHGDNLSRYTLQMHTKRHFMNYYKMKYLKNDDYTKFKNYNLFDTYLDGMIWNARGVNEYSTVYKYTNNCPDLSKKYYYNINPLSTSLLANTIWDGEWLIIIQLNGFSTNYTGIVHYISKDEHFEAEVVISSNCILRRGRVFKNKKIVIYHLLTRLFNNEDSSDCINKKFDNKFTYQSKNLNNENIMKLITYFIGIGINMYSLEKINSNNENFINLEKILPKLILSENIIKLNETYEFYDNKQNDPDTRIDKDNNDNV